MDGNPGPVLTEELASQLGQRPDLVYDPELSKETAPPQKLTKHQQRQLRKKQLAEKTLSRTQQKLSRKEEARKLLLQKYNQRDQILQEYHQQESEKPDKTLLKPTHHIGIKLSKKQQYLEALSLKAQNLPYNQDIIDEYEAKIEEAKKAQEEIQYELVSPPEETEVPKAPSKPLIDPKPKPVITETVPRNHKVEKPTFEEGEKAIHVKVNRKPEIQALRESLPVYDFETTIMEQMNDNAYVLTKEEFGDLQSEKNTNDVIVICGETGSGKTTQVPQFFYEAGYGTLRTKGKIAVTEPRRVAAMSMAARVSEELNSTLGNLVGYHVRHNPFFSDSTVIKFLTDGVLLRELETDLLLEKYSVIIIDEAHERTVNTDVLIGLLSKVVKMRRKKGVEPLKLVIMSATLRIGDFINNQKLFPEAPPLIQVEGRRYPVALHWMKNTPTDYLEEVKNTVKKIHEEYSTGGILVFLPGKREIISMVNEFKDNEEMHVLPLYALLTNEEQSRVFQKPPEGKRVVVFSTNVAETSITIPDIRFVVDSGLEKGRVFDFTTGSVLSKVRVISKASADQRMGRTGRTGEGHCFRLYSPAFYSKFNEYSDPEIVRKPIEEVVLLLKVMGLPDVSLFPFPTVIPEASLALAETTLKHISALDKDGRPTPLGKLMGMIPMPPRLSKFILICRNSDLLDYAVMIASALSVREPLINQNRVDEEERGDVMKLLRLFGLYMTSIDKEKVCQEYGLRKKAMEEMVEVREQIGKVLNKAGFSYAKKSIKPPSATEESVLLQALFSCYCDKVAHKTPSNDYETADGFVRKIKGDSVLFQSKPYWLFYTDIDDDRLVNCNKLSVSWIASLGSPLMLQRGEVKDGEYRRKEDSVVGRVNASFGKFGWKLGEVTISHPDPYNIFAGAFLSGEVFESLRLFRSKLAARVEDVKHGRKLPMRLELLVNRLKQTGVKSRAEFLKQIEKESHFCLNEFLYWIPDLRSQEKAQKIWNNLAGSAVSESDSDSDE